MGLTTLTNVDAYAQIALDVRDMADHIDRNEASAARRVAAARRP